MSYQVIDRYVGSENTWYRDKIEGNGSEYSLNNLHRCKDIITEGYDNWIEIEYCCGSDYSGSSVEASNYKCMRDDYGDHPDVAFTYGDYGSYGVIYRENTKDQDLQDLVSGLADYSLISEDENSRLEMEWADEAWESWAESDYKQALIKKFTEDLDVVKEEEIIVSIEDKIDTIESSKLREIFENARDEANVYWESENSGMHVDIDRVVKKTTAEDLGL